MPRIPQILAQQTPQGFINGGRSAVSAPDLTGLVRGVQSVADAGYERDAQARREAEAEARRQAAEDAREREAMEINEARIQVINTTSQLEADWTDQFTTRSQQAPSDAAGFTRETLADFDARAKAAEDTASTRAKPFLRLQLAQLRARVQQKASGFETQARQVAVLGDADRGIETDARTVFQDPTQYAEVLARRRGGIAGLATDPVTREKLTAKAIDQITMSAALGRVERDPEGVLRTLGFGGGSPEPAQQDERRIDPAVQFARDQERLRILRAEQADPAFDSTTRDAVGREITRLEAQLAKGPPPARAPVSQQQIASASATIQSDPVFANIPPEKIGPVLHRAQTLVAQRRAEAERSARDVERQVADTAKAYIGMLKDGDQPPADQVAALRSGVAGTVYAAALAQAEQQAATIAAFRGLPMPEQRRQIDAMQVSLNAGKLDPEQRALFETLAKNHERTAKAFADDPMAAALASRVLPQGLAQVQTEAVSTLVQTLPARAQQARSVAAHLGTPVSPLTAAEADQVGSVLRQLPPEQMGPAVAEIARSMDPAQTAALARQIAPKDQALGIALGMSSDRTTEGRYAAELVLRGAQSLKDKTFKDEVTSLPALRAEIAAEIGDAYPNQEQRAAMIEAALLVRVGLASERGGSTRQAIAIATGGLTEHNGRKIPLPYGVSADDFTRRLAAITPDTLRGQIPDGKVYSNGAPMESGAFLQSLPGAQLMHAGRGRYFVRSGGSVVTNNQGRPVVIEVR